MQKIIMIACVFALSLSLKAVEPQNNIKAKKPLMQIVGGKVMGKARVVGMNSKAVVVTCDKAKEVCLYVAKKKVSDNDSEIEDYCKVVEPWPIPLALEAVYDQNFPYAVALAAPVLNFIAATDVTIGCPDEEGAIQVTVTTEATISTP